ncbi:MULTISPECIES: hypothetical protein [Acinetobacter]|nr:hypothetical protein [Acinetobacter higginsii]
MNQARENFKQYSAMEERFIREVGKPTGPEIPKN